MTKDSYSGLHAKCVNQKWSGTDLTEGNVYAILYEAGEENEYFAIIDDNGVNGVFYKERFILTDEPITK